MKARFAVILFLILLGFVFAFAIQIFNKFLSEFDPLFSGTALAAFLGAFFAFLFVRMGDFLKAYSDRMSKSHNTLIKLEHRFNNLLDSLDGNIYIIKVFEEIYSQYENKSEKSNSVFIWANRLKPVGQLDDLVIGVTNIDLINELFTVDIRLRKLNESMETLNGAYLESKDALLRKDIDPENYMVNVKQIRKNLLELKKFIQTQINECLGSLSSVRVLARNRPLIGSLIRLMPGYKYNSRFESEKDLEIKKLKQEIEAAKKRGQERIDGVLNGNKKNS